MVDLMSYSNLNGASMHIDEDFIDELSLNDPGSRRSVYEVEGLASNDACQPPG